jgi:dipeptidyl-peptidase-4
MRIFHWLLLVWSSSFAQSDPAFLTLDRIFNSTELVPRRFGPAQWLDGGIAYTTLEPSAAGRGSDIIRYDCEKGTRTALIAAEKLVPSGKSEPLTISSYQWSSDRTRLMIFTNTRKVWRYKTRGDYWMLDLKTWELKQLGGPNVPEASLMFAKFSPDGKSVAYVRQNNLYVERFSDGSVTALTTDGSSTLINGTFDWVYEEEWDLRDGFRWSPDGRHIAYWQLNADSVRNFLMINTTDSVYSSVIPVQYPKAGEMNSACRIGIVSSSGGPTTWMNIDGDPRNQYLNAMEWAGPDKIAIRHMNRLQNECRLLIGDVSTGTVRTVFSDRDSAWIDVREYTFNPLKDASFHVVRGGKEFLWFSERDGWRHVYRIDLNGAITDMTPGSYDVVDIAGVDEKTNILYFIASPENSAYRFLYRVTMDGKGKYSKLTPDDRGVHDYNLSPSTRFAFQTTSTIDRPSEVRLIDLPRHRTLRVLEDNGQIMSKLKALHIRPTEYFTLAGPDGITLDAWIMKPADFDSAKKYPLLFYVYGEPGSQRVIDRFRRSDHLWHWLLTQQGYIVAGVDCRGTPALKGRAWRKAVYKQMGYLGPIDIAFAARTLRQWPFIDSTRIGVWGWSGGGATTLQAIFRWPEIFMTGISVAPVTDQRYYDNVYTERYMGLPQENAEAYRRSAPLTYAHQLKGHLLLVHGTGDDNVHYQNTEALINALVAANRSFHMMAYPNRSHSIDEGTNTTLHLRTMMTDFLHRYLPPGGR